ncbi:MAG: hypothetical protein NUV77_24265 [Thermoguttaceae bacterium]|jgi:hypothetical protein|nr:hypothetical protein [Thermoguttaceae bacterium]
MILLLARRLGYRIAEVPVSWTEKPGGHFHPARELPSVLASLWRLRRRMRSEIVLGAPAAEPAEEPASPLS